MNINLTAADVRHLEPVPARLGRGLQLGFSSASEGLAAVAEILATFERTPTAAPWRSYWALDAETSAYVGLCGFKAEPDPDRSVEIAYFTFPLLEGRAVATAMARGLLEIARRSGADAIVAHTLPQRNASGAILQRVGFSWVGQTRDPEDGLVWRWRLSVRDEASSAARNTCLP